MFTKKFVSFVAAIFVILISILGYKLYLEKNTTADLARKYVDASEKYESAQKTLIGYTSFTSYSAVLNKELSAQMKFIGAKTTRQYVHFENIEVKKLGITSYAAIELKYTVEYAVGYDLSSGNFKLDANEKGITIFLKKPELAAKPSVTESKTKTLSGGMLIDEKKETIDLLNKLPQIASANNRTSEILQDEAIVALCEKKIKEFVRGVLINQHKVEIIPDIVIVYM